MKRDQGAVRPKLEVGASNDPLEHEADRVADKVVRMRAGGECASCAMGLPCEGCGQTVHRASDGSSSGSSGGSLAPYAAAGIARSAQGGEPLPSPVRASMEPRFGADFSGVRIHRDSAAGDSAKSIGARAYTLGNHIAFGHGQWSPGTDRGDHLIAHELTHTLQEGGVARTVRGDFLDDISDAAEGLVEDVAETAEEGLNLAREVTEEVVDAAVSAAGAAIQSAGAVADDVADAVNSAASVANEETDEAALHDLWEDFRSKAQPLVALPENFASAIDTLENLKSAVLTPAVLTSIGAATGGQLSSATFEPEDKGSAGGCGLCFGLPRDAGNASHRLLQSEFETKLLLMGLEPLIEFALPGVRPDLAWWRSKNRLELGEIKPHNPQGRIAGLAKLNVALPAARAEFPGAQVAPLGVDIGTIAYMPTGSITPGCETQKLRVTPPTDGVYLYWCEPSYRELRARGCRCRGEEPVTPPVVVKEEKKAEETQEDKSKEAEKELTGLAAFVQFLREHPVERTAFLLALALVIATVILFTIPEPLITKILGIASGVLALAGLVAIFISFQVKEGGNSEA